MPAYDVVVVGAGSAGCAAAYQLARRGFRVAVLERGRLAQAGARWVNGVAPWMFDQAGIPRPAGGELRGRDCPFVLCAPHSGARVEVARSPVWQVDMRLLVARLQALASGAGVHFFEHTGPLAMQFAGERPVAAVTAGGLIWRAGLFVDATGVRGALRRLVPALSAGGERLARADVCGAAQQVRRIADATAARAYLARWGVAPGACLGFVGLAGGYSTLVVQVDTSLREVDLLAGTASAEPGVSGLGLLTAFAAGEPWVGGIEFGGQGAIPLRRPWERFAVPGAALVGDAACQVFPAHGSGVGPGLLAARVLAEQAAGHADAGGAAAMHAYQAGYMREHGAVAAAYDVFRRLSQELDGAEVERLIATGLVSSASSVNGLAQRMPAAGAGEALRLVWRAARAPRLAARMAPALAKMPVVYALARRMPRGEHAVRSALWRRGLRWAAGPHAPQEGPLHGAEGAQARDARPEREQHALAAQGRETEQRAQRRHIQKQRQRDQGARGQPPEGLVAHAQLNEDVARP